ncbi:hypothetical protein F5I97DRAFT_1850760, partial [Phlebopus sp. FC_14]
TRSAHFSLCHLVCYHFPVLTCGYEIIGNIPCIILIGHDNNAKSAVSDLSAREVNILAYRSCRELSQLSTTA